VSKRKTSKILNEAEYYTGVQGQPRTPETMSAYEYSSDNTPTLEKLANLKNNGQGGVNPEALPYPLQDAVLQLANLYLQTLDLKNKAATAENLPLFKGKAKELKKMRAKLAGIMVAYKELAAHLNEFTLAPK
jgi:hypothetical protein